MTLQRVSQADGNWHGLCRQWEDECDGFEQDFAEFASASFPVLDELACGTQLANAGVFATHDDGGYLAACQANVCFLPGYDGKVLRVRHIIVSPQHEFSADMEIETYLKTLGRVFVGAIGLSVDGMPAQHVKFHLRSPAERHFGHIFTEALEGHKAFSDVAMRGSWIYLSKPNAT